MKFDIFLIFIGLLNKVKKEQSRRYSRVSGGTLYLKRSHHSTRPKKHNKLARARLRKNGG